MPDALTFTVLRLLSDSQFRSAAALAAELGVPRGAVANAIQHLDALGREVRHRAAKSVAGDYLLFFRLRGLLSALAAK